MQRAPVIGLTTYPPRAGLARYHLPVEYVDSVRRAGALPVMVAPGEERLEELLEHLDGLILSGGGDVDPARYGGDGEAHLDGVDAARDTLELALARLAHERALPMLGICRGLQVVNVAFGGSLVEDMAPGATVHRGAGGTSVLHRVLLDAGSRVRAIVGEESPETSSKHHQAVRRLAPGLRVTAHAPDGTIEAFERDDHPFYLAVQWHPEETAARDPGQQRLFEALAAAARAHHEDPR